MKFTIVDTFSGYENKRDVTKQAPGVMITGSRNVISTDGETVASRQGYSLLGAANTSLNPIEASYDWIKLRVGKISLRAYDDELEFFYSSTAFSGGDDTWYKLADGWSSVNFSFTTFFNTTEQDDEIVFVNGDNNLYTWSGGIATFASATANTLTLQGTTTWAELGFLTSGTRTIRVLDDTGVWREATYTGGESTTTLTGVSVDLTAFTISAGQIITQKVQTISNKPASAAPFTNDIVQTFNNQLIVGSTNDRTLYISAAGDKSTYAPSSPRLPGEGASLTLDAPPNAIVLDNSEQGNSFYVSAGEDYWYKIDFELSSDLTNESVNVLPLKTATGQSANNKRAFTYIKNYIGFISNEPTFDLLGRIENIDTQQSKPLSDPIKTDFDGYDFTDVNLKYYKNNVYIALPQESKLLIFNLEKGFWEAPWDMPAGRLAIIDGNLCLHSNAVPETYKLFDGYNDNGNPINAVARFSYLSYNDRYNYKDQTLIASEGYITTNTALNNTIVYDFEGFNGTTNEVITGTDDDILFSAIAPGSLGDLSLGEQSLGSGGGDTAKSKFKLLKKAVKNRFFEQYFEFSSNDVDQQWEIISFGSDVTISSTKPIKITR